MDDVLLLGLGNPLRGDDGVGPRVVQELKRRGLPENVTALDGGAGGLGLLPVLEGRRRVVVVDAADVGQEPGRFVRFTPAQARLAQATDRLDGLEGPSHPDGLESLSCFSIHQAGLSEVLALASALGRDLPELVIFGVQPAELGWREGLSPAVEAALPALADAVFNEIKGENHAQGSGH